VIPTLSLDSAWVLERDTSFFGRSMRQTLEPRLLYVNTPYHDQTFLPNFDASAGKDFNFDSIFTENAFSGVDRVSDAHQVTAGVTTRCSMPTPAPSCCAWAAQRYLLRDQLVTPGRHAADAALVRPAAARLDDADRRPGSWTPVQYSPDIHRTVRSIVGARYSPGPYRTISATPTG
jgi:LPS-assembly protein